MICPRASTMRGLFLAACLLAALAPLAWPSVPPREAVSVDWPSTFEGRPLRALPPADVDRRFASGFPGRIARFTDGAREIVMRHVDGPTRMLHPASDCFRGAGYVVKPLAPVDGWARFEAARGGDVLIVRERIESRDGRWSDVSAWYWDALLGRTPGPWTAIVVAERPQVAGRP